mmetsp:Transcript_29463/g.50884  ORF Transcript_29463/g.50884 Transcript_29463/m.50884 type:complete len:144 (-) Transcript_29463:370-801(-)
MRYHTDIFMALISKGERRTPFLISVVVIAITFFLCSCYIIHQEECGSHLVQQPAWEVGIVPNLIDTKASKQQALELSTWGLFNGEGVSYGWEPYNEVTHQHPWLATCVSMTFLAAVIALVIVLGRFSTSDVERADWQDYDTNY